MADIDLKSDFDGRSNYDLNDYTQGKFDGMIASGEVSSPEGEIKNEGEVDDEMGTCTDIGDYLDDEAGDEGGDGDGDG